VRERKSIERGLLVSGGLLVAIYAGYVIENKVLAKLAVKNFEAKTVPMIAETSQRSPEYQQAKFTPWSRAAIDVYDRALTQHSLPTLAVLRISRLNLEVPVLDGTDDVTLRHGAGWIRGTARPEELGNVGIAGHRDGVFRPLKDSKIHDTVDLMTHAHTYTYQVDNIRIVSPDDVGVLRSADTRSLTLVTCYPFYFVGSAPQRYIVHASIIHSQSLIKRTDGTARSLNDKTLQ